MAGWRHILTTLLLSCLAAWSFSLPFFSSFVVRLEYPDGTFDEFQARDLSFEPGPLSSEFRFKTPQGTLRRSTTQLHRICFHHPVYVNIYSGKETRYFSLGKERFALPSPPNWMSSHFKNPHWKETEPAHRAYFWHYMPPAQWLWSATPWTQASDEIALFRSRFFFPDEITAAEATLRVSADDVLRAAYLNSKLVNRYQRQLRGEIAEYDVLPALQHGENLLALSVHNGESKGVNFAGLAFHLEVLGHNEKEKDRSAETNLVLLRNGDRLRGKVLSGSGEELQVQTSYGRLSLALEWIDRIFFYDSSPGAVKECVELSGVGQRRTGGALLRDNRFVSGEFFALDLETLSLKPAGAGTISLPRTQVAMMQFDGREPPLVRFRSQFLSHLASVKMLNGDELTAILQAANARWLELTPVFGSPTRIKTNRVFWIRFPYCRLMHYKHKQKSTVSEGTPQLALMGSYDQETPYEQTIHYRVSRLLYELEIPYQELSPQVLTNSEEFNPRKYPLLINVDEKERYYHTIKEEGDGERGLVGYVKEGGSIINLTRGVPFYFGLIPQGGKWLVAHRGDRVVSTLGLKIMSLTNDTPEAKPFELPPADEEGLYFIRRTFEELSTLNLPPEVPFPTTGDPRFRPMVSHASPLDGQFYPIYTLNNESGESYGTGMAMVRYSGGNFVAYANHTLTLGEYRETPMLNFLLPFFLSLGE